MKRVKLFECFLVTLALFACEFNQSTNKDLTTGAYTRGDGLSSDEIIIEINGAVENRNKFINGEKVKFIFNNITGLKKENGKSYPGLSLYIVKNDKDTVLQNNDLLAKLEDGTELSPLQLQAKFTAILPHDNKESYKALVKIWDKKGDGSLRYELPFTIGPNNLLKINEQELTYTNIFLWDNTENHVVVNNKINITNEFIFALEGIDGLEIVDNKVFPSLSMEIIDNNGNQVMRSSNVLETISLSGVDPERFKNNQLPITISFTGDQINNPCKLNASLTDLMSNRKINITGELIIQ